MSKKETLVGAGVEVDTGATVGKGVAVGVGEIKGLGVGVGVGEIKGLGVGVGAPGACKSDPVCEILLLSLQAGSKLSKPKTEIETNAFFMRRTMHFLLGSVKLTFGEGWVRTILAMNIHHLVNEESKNLPFLSLF